MPADTTPRSVHPILAAALALGGVAPPLAAQSPPDNASLSLRYLSYRDSQPGLERIRVDSPALALVLPLAGVWSVEASLTQDQVSGASPRYHTAISGASRMDDLRYAASLNLTRYFEYARLGAGLVYSDEHDYRSRAASLQLGLDSTDKNSTLTLGIGSAADAIYPVRQSRRDTRQTDDAMLGWTQVLSAHDLAQFSLSHSRGRGYFSDPYKALDIRPRQRDQSALLGRWHHFFENGGSVLRLNYRYYRDSFAIRAHTLGLEYARPLANGWTVTPELRLYTQSAAAFYFDPVYSYLYLPVGYTPGQTPYVSEDQRLAAFGAATVALKIDKQFGDDWSADLKFELYRQRGGWRFDGSGSPGLAELRAHVLQIGLKKNF